MNATLLVDLIHAVKTKEVNASKEPTSTFMIILTKDRSPRDFQNDEILPDHFEINPKIEYQSIENNTRIVYSM